MLWAGRVVGAESMMMSLSLSEGKEAFQCGMWMSETPFPKFLIDNFGLV